jgi:SpoVK/Ycf46/Vps4 family AAA+-type ATPase
MAATVVARSLSRTLYRVDLATIVSKWVGETERNLREAMHSAEAVGAVLLFDEGDALFGKRGEISRGADRYANLEVSYLLQAVERYSGVLILTTNQQHQIDPAFLRRFDVAIHFEAPDAVQRRAIWEAELEDASAKLDPEVILRISRAAQLCGGNIAAAARMARLLACSRGETQVSLRDLEEAIQSELHKLGSTVSATAWSRGEARKGPSGSSFGEVAGGATNGRERARNAV